MNELLMKKTLELSLENEKNNFQDGGPFGALIADTNGNIIATGKNEVLKEKDPTMHAEVCAIRNACKKLNTHDLTGYILYTSCYPCPMCMSAAIWSNIKTIYYGNTQKDADKIGFRDDVIYKFLEGKENLLDLIQINREITIEGFEIFEKNNKKEMY